MYTYPILNIFLTIIILISAVKNIEDESSDEDTMDAIILGRKRNMSRLHQPSTKLGQDAMVEKFLDSLISSERYLEMLEKKMTHLDVTVHEKTNSIMKYLVEILRKIKTKSNDEVEMALRSVKNDLDAFKDMIVQKMTPPQMRGNGNYYIN